MVLGHLPLDLMYLGLELVIQRLGAHVLLAGGDSLRVNRLMKLQLCLFFLFFPGESVPFAGEALHLPPEVGDSVLLVPNLDELLLGDACPGRLDLSLESGDGAKLFLLVALVLLMQLFGLLTMDVLVGDCLLDDRADQLLQLVDLTQQLPVLEHQARPIPQRHLDSLLRLDLLS